MHTTLRWVTAIVFGLVATSPALAQSGVATLTHVDGGVTRAHHGSPAAATSGVPVMDGDRIETANGRAEIAFPDGALVHLDRNAGVIVHAGERIQALGGRVSLRVGGMKGYVADTASSKVHVQAGSVVEITTRADGPEVQLRVISGAARMESPWGSSRVADYHTAFVAGPASTPVVNKIVPTLADDFERWALARVVLATSMPLRGTENGGGVAYHPYYAYAYSSYPTAVYYSSPYAAAPYYGSSYYGSTYFGSSYYANPYGSSYGAPPSYYYAPSRSYYGGHGSYYGGNEYSRSYATPGYRERYSWTTPSSPATRLPMSPPSSWPAPAPPAGSVKRAAVPKP